MRLITGLLCSLFVIAVFLLLIRLEPELSNTLRQDTLSLQQAIQTVEKLQMEANNYFLLHENFNQFRELLFTESEKIFSEAVEPDFLAKELPPHQLTVALADMSGNVLRLTDLNGQIDHEFIRSFVRFDYMYVRQQQEDVFFNPKYKGELEKADQMLYRILGNRGDRTTFLPLRASRLSRYGSTDSRAGFYWDHQRLADGSKVYFFCRLDLIKPDGRLPLSAAVKKYSNARQRCSFYDSHRHSFYQAGPLQRFARTRILATVERFCRARGKKAGKEDAEQIMTVLRSGTEIAVIGREMAGTTLTPVVIARNEDSRSFSIARNDNVWLLAIISLGMIIFIQTAVFGRGLKLNVGKMLIISSMMAIFMPFMMGRSIFRLILNETSANENLKLERELHGILSGIDSGVRLFHANLFQNFIRLLTRDETIIALEEAQKIQKRLEAEGKIGETDPTAASEIVFNISRDSFLPFETGITLNEDRRSRANAVLILGPDNFMRFYDRFKLGVVGHVRDSRNDSMFLLLNLYRMTLEPFFPLAEMVEGLATTASRDKTVEMEKFMYDEVKAQIVGALGADKFFEMFSNFEGLNLMRTSVGITHFSVFPLRWRGLIRFFCGIGWDEFTISDIYLKNVFANLRHLKQKKRRAGEGSIFAFIDPAFHFAREHVFLQGFGGLRGDTVFSGEVESPRLGMLIKSAYRSKRPVKFRSEGQDSAIYQVVPGRYFSLYTLGARQETSHLYRIEKWRSIIFAAGLLLFLFLLPYFAAVNISRSFTGPLEHLLWGLSKVEKSDYSIRLKDSREDEFGSISRAFNFMTRRLREKDTLGKFVSDSVRRLAASPQLFKQAQDGVEAEVTILFADLEGFSTFVEKADAAEVQRKLEFSLASFFAAAEKFGGEVDKVIGEKLLIVFPHSEGRKNAANAAIKLVAHISELFRRKKFFVPLFGVNSGMVISGIIGTAAVRMDNTIIGDPVNVAARLCSLAGAANGRIIVSGDICEALGKSFNASRLSIEKIRGKKQEVEVFSLQLDRSGQKH
jgi:adenylate cyclase